LCQLYLEQFEQATEMARQAQGAQPDNPMAHYAGAVIYRNRNRPNEALLCLKAALSLAPDNPDYLSFAAFMAIDESDWESARQWAEKGLAHQPSHEGCVNARAIALIRSGLKSDAREALENALAEDPENPLTLANLGWVELESNDHKKALSRFQEALSLEPELEWARDGFVHALRAQYPLYGVILKYNLWMVKHSHQVQQQMVLVSFIARRALDSLAERYPALAALLAPLLLVWRLFTYLTWVARAATSLLLRLNPYGRKILTAEELLESNLVGSLWLGALLCWLYNLFIGSVTAYLGNVIFVTAPLLCGATFSCHKGWPRQVMGAATAILLGAGLIGLFLFVFRLPISITFLKIYFYGLGPTLLASNFLVGVRPQR
ncbi:MAG: tetratricopeptide repeat protein, partial [Candidatus Eremiobacteraeota bacterium]|nr:tetratricopeptide repeat protein [Candidatus Eremiobacteraeota bacterium]